MARVSMRFYGPLNDFLALQLRGRSFEQTLTRQTSVKDLIEAVGVPHPEVGGIVVDGERVDFGHRVREGERIAVYPPLRRIAITAAPRDPIRFVLDGHLGTLARYLRMAGFDTQYRNDVGDAELARISAETGRVLLTRDRGLLKRRIVVYGYWLRAHDPQDQLAEVAERFALADHARPLSRCPRCNGVLRGVDKAAIAHRLAPLTRRYYDEFRICPDCDQLYWRGSHVAGIESLLERSWSQVRCP